MVNQEVRLTRECKATLIPAGDKVVIPKGSQLFIVQALGGSLTVHNEKGLFRIENEDVDALGDELAQQFREQSERTLEDEIEFSEALVWNSLKTCFDPEIPVNIVDLGLIYDLTITDLQDGRHKIDVIMTLTARGCGMGPSIAADVKAKIEALPAVEKAEVEIIWDPQWTPHMISIEGRKMLGLD